MPAGIRSNGNSFDIQVHIFQRDVAHQRHEPMPVGQAGVLERNLRSQRSLEPKTDAAGNMSQNEILKLTVHYRTNRAGIA